MNSLGLQIAKIARCYYSDVAFLTLVAFDGRYKLFTTQQINADFGGNSALDDSRLRFMSYPYLSPPQLSAPIHRLQHLKFELVFP